MPLHVASHHVATLHSRRIKPYITGIWMDIVAPSGAHERKQRTPEYCVFVRLRRIREAFNRRKSTRDKRTRRLYTRRQEFTTLPQAICLTNGMQTAQEERADKQAGNGQTDNTKKGVGKFCNLSAENANRAHLHVMLRNAKRLYTGSLQCFSCSSCQKKSGEQSVTDNSTRSKQIRHADAKRVPYDS